MLKTANEIRAEIFLYLYNEHKWTYRRISTVFNMTHENVRLILNKYCPDFKPRIAVVPRSDLHIIVQKMKEYGLTCEAIVEIIFRRDITQLDGKKRKELKNYGLEFKKISRHAKYPKQKQE